MSLDSWLTGASPSPMKRKLDEDKENASPSKRFKKELNQTSFDCTLKILKDFIIVMSVAKITSPHRMLRDQLWYDQITR